MKILVFGASGQTGQQVVIQAIEMGYQVTAFVRNAKKIEVASPNLTIYEGDCNNIDAVKTAVSNHDVVINCLGRQSNKPSNELYLMTKNIVDAMQLVNVSRLIQIATAGIENELDGFIGKAIGMMLKNTISDHRHACAYVKNSTLEYTIARPVSLTNGVKKGAYRETLHGVPYGGYNISRKDVASFMLKACVEKKYIYQSVGLAY